MYPSPPMMRTEGFSAMMSRLGRKETQKRGLAERTLLTSWPHWTEGGRSVQVVAVQAD